MEVASQLCWEDSMKELQDRGILLPCRKISPLQPPLRMEEYEMMERDRGKCEHIDMTCVSHTWNSAALYACFLPGFIFFVDFLYWTAITKAIQDIYLQKSSTRQGRHQDVTQLTCLVFGAGLGRLVQYCIDAVQQSVQSSGTEECSFHHCNQQTITCDVHAVDANPLAIDCLRNQFELQDHPHGIKVIVHPSFTLFPGMQREDLPADLCNIHRECDLVVSELLGCFGCDEFLPELTSTLSRLFLINSGGVCIPKDWTTYIAPIQSACLHDALAGKPTSTYTVGLPQDCIFMCEPQSLWKGSCKYYQSPCNIEGIGFEFSPFMLNECQNTEVLKIQPHPPLSQFMVHGLIGYFTSCLYDNITIDTRHTGCRNSYHWEGFYMPLSRPMVLPVSQTDGVSFKLLANVQRTCSISRSALTDRLWSPQAGLNKQALMSLNYSWNLKLFIQHTDCDEMKLNQHQSEIGNKISISC